MLENSFGVKEKTKENIKLRKKYNCVYHNDDKTTFEFVSDSLMSVFKLSEEEAFMVTYAIHSMGKGVANKKPLSKDIAETKMKEVLEMAREEGFPLMITVEECN